MPARALPPEPLRRNFWICTALTISFCHPSVALAVRNSADLADLSLEQLGDIEVTSVSRSNQPLHSAAAAIAVVTADDIRRSGATTIPEALRNVPGLHVAQQLSNAWAISARGFSSVNSEKLLVLSDTRSIYTPLFSGVLWDVQDYFMDDIDRIEVIRGPGASLWGSNAVNGVINITTKSAQETQGTRVEALAGSEERATVAARHGGTTDGGVAYRIFTKYFDRDGTHNSAAQSTDDWRMGHAGMRSDWASGADSFTVQGDLYEGTVGRLVPSITVIGRAGPTGALDVDVRGGNILGRWRHDISADSNFVLRAYYDNTHRDDPSYRDDLDTYDVDFQHQFLLTPRQEFLWGLNYRSTDNRNVGKGIFNVEPASSRDDLISAFVQDQIALLDTLALTLGTKFEHNNFSGDEWQPSIRLAWDLTPTQVLWGAASRAVRVPTRLERDIAVDVLEPPANPAIRLSGNRKFEPEELEAYEMGYRWQGRANLSVDIATFYNRYDGLASLELGQPFIDARDGRSVIPILNENLTDGHTSGVETLVVYSPLPNWRLSANYSYLDMQLEPRGLDINRGRFLAGATPRHQVGLRSSVDLRGGLQFDVTLRYLSAIRHLPDIVDGSGIGDYAEMDARLAKRISANLELSLVGQNLLHPRHTEFGTPEGRGEIERSVYAKAVWSF